MTLGEHVQTGGLASLVSQELVNARLMPKFWSQIALPDSYSSIVGSQEYLRTRLGVDVKAIVARVSSQFKR